jgi:Fe-S cluster biogenesis protein NfuA
VVEALPGDPDLARRVEGALDRHVRPYLQGHGGDVVVTAVSAGRVEVEFVAACAACELRPVTFAATVRARLLQVPGVESVSCEAVSFAPGRLDAIAAFYA